MVVAHDLKDSQRTKDVYISQDVTFDSMLLSSNTLEGLKKSGFIRPSPIQLHGIPLGKCGFDLLLESKSGTGKTAVFTIIALERIDLEKDLQAIILAPTREIAAQICDVIRHIGSQFKGLCVEVVMGGLPVQDDIEKFKQNKVHIVVGSPGRLRHLIADQYIDVSAARLLVLDEADKLMEKSFLADVENIFLALPPQKQVIMSSATFPEDCKKFIEQFAQDMQHICPSSDCVLLGVAQKVTYVKYNKNTVMQTRIRVKELLRIITTIQFKQCLIFCNYQVRVGEVHKMLTKEKWPAEQLYGSQDQTERLDALKTLQEYKCRILISTDLAARGIDASNVDLVINFDPPSEWQTYLHRIGRAGRFGAYGMAITIVSEGAEQKKFMNSLSVVDISSKLSPLWKDNKSYVKSEQPSLSNVLHHSQLNGFEDHDYTELWNIICNSENPSEDNVYSFHELSKSFENSRTNTEEIESFSDLFCSFQNSSLPNNKECLYKCIKWPNISAIQYLVRLKNKLGIVEQSDNNPDEFCINSDSSSEKNYIKSKIKINNSNIPTGNNSTCFHKERPTNSVNTKLEDFVQNEKHVNRISKNINLFSNTEFSHREESSFSDSNENKLIRTNKTNATKGLTKQNSYKSANSHKGISSKNYVQSTTRQSSTSEKTDSVYITEENVPSKSYNDWYKQLKFRVKQLELAIYIDELSKIS